MCVIYIDIEIIYCIYNELSVISMLPNWLHVYVEENGLDQWTEFIEQNLELLVMDH